MKIIKNFKENLSDTKKSIRRFPITILFSIVLTIMLVYLNEHMYTGDNTESLQRINMVLALGIPLSLSIALYMENAFKSFKSSIIAQIGTLFLLPVYYYLLLKDLTFESGIRFAGTIIFFILFVFYSSKLNKKLGYERYVIKLISGGLITAIYAAVLYGGLAIILFTIQALFDVNIQGKLYYYIFLLVIFIFGVIQFLSKIPHNEDDPTKYDYAKALKILLTYIVIPLIVVYTIILYVYFIKIIITWVWPKGLVSHLVLWYTTLSVGIIFLITPIIEENKIAKSFKKFFPIFILPILGMMFISIGQRISQYGFTENRYFVVILGLWVLGVMLYFNIRRFSNNLIIPISLSLVILISVYGPLSSFSVAKRAQNNRLESVLRDNDILVNGYIVKNLNVSKDGQQEINNILSYFDKYHSIEDIDVLPDGFELVNTEDLLGFQYNPEYYYYENNQYFGYYSNLEQYSIDISEYDYLFNITAWNQQAIVAEDVQVKYNTDNQVLEVLDKNSINYITININDVALSFYNKLKTNEGPVKDVLGIDDLTYVIENEYVEVKLIFQEISGNIDISEKAQVKSSRFMMLLNNK